MIHRTVVPTLTVIVAGENWKPLATEPITSTSAWGPSGVVVEVAVDCPVVPAETVAVGVPCPLEEPVSLGEPLPLEEPGVVECPLVFAGELAFDEEVVPACCEATVDLDAVDVHPATSRLNRNPVAMDSKRARRVPRAIGPRISLTTFPDVSWFSGIFRPPNCPPGRTTGRAATHIYRNRSARRLQYIGLVNSK